MDVINVGLYGGKSIFGGKESPLEASVISCDKYMNCSFYQSGHCLKVRSFGGPSCQFGRVSTHKGYTSRARKYYEFERQWKTHEEYGKLTSPSRKLGLIEGFVVFPYPFIRLEIEGDKITIGNPGFWDNTPFIPIELFTVELVQRICSFRPRAMMGGEIEDFQKEKVPLFLAHLKEVIPDLYAKLIAIDAVHEQKINYVGRKALLRTVQPSSVHYKSSPQYSQFNEKWIWDGEHLTFDGGYKPNFNVTKGYDVIEIKIKPHENATIIISENEQVSEKTVFID